MIFITCCNSCFQGYEVQVLPDEQPLLDPIRDANGLIDCPRLCGGKITGTSDPNFASMMKGMSVLHLTAEQLFQAVHGMGLPDEHERDPDVLDALLRTSTVAKTVTRTYQGRLYIDEIHLSGGQVIHLTAGMQGAEVLKVTKRRESHGAPHPG